MKRTRQSTAVTRHPIDHVEWREAAALRANGWNPNMVHKAEMDLLEESILRQGWIQPVLITNEGIVIDGYHRWTIASRPGPVRDRDGGRLPCAVIDLSEAEAKLLTVRINRAKGTHVALRMSELVSEVVESGMPIEEVMVQLGATRREVETLLAGDMFKAFDVDHWQYSPAWEPEDKRA